jgi:hypothetical protein
VNVAPLAALLVVLAIALLMRRAFGRAGSAFALLVGSLAGLLLATNMLQVWQAKYQTAEAFTQALIVGAARHRDRHPDGLAAGGRDRRAAARPVVPHPFRQPAAACRRRRLRAAGARPLRRPPAGSLPGWP